MDTLHDVNVDNFFSRDVQYKVPRYQRRYVWDQTNWRTLWEDIFSQLGLELDDDKNREILVKQYKQHEAASGSTHFTGIIVTQTTRKKQE